MQQYQIDVDPNRLRAYSIPLSTVVEAVQRSNSNVGGNVIEHNGQWSIVRGVGLIESVADFENIVIGGSGRHADLRAQCRRRKHRQCVSSWSAGP